MAPHQQQQPRQKLRQRLPSRRRPRATPSPWTSTTAVLFSLVLGGCKGFTIVGKPHGITTSSGPNRPRFPSLARHLIPSPLTPFPSPVPGFGQCRPNLRRSGPRLNTAMGGNRPGGYGRFDDAENEPSVRGYAPPPPPPPSARQEEETRRGGWEEGSRRSGGREGGREWEEIGNADVLVPKGLEYPLGVVHFVGGQGVGVFPKNAYGTLLEALADAGFLVVATRVRLNEFNHEELACDVARDFRVAYRDVEALYGRGVTRQIPLFGVGHSLGAKVHVLLNCYPEVTEVAKRRKANVMISFNNFPAKDSVPFLNELRDLGLAVGNLGPLEDNLSGIAKAVAGFPFATQGMSLAEEWAPKAAAAVGLALSDVPQEFKPSPQATWDLLMDEYSVRNNLVLQFKRDTIDQSPKLAETLFKHFGRDGELEFSRLDGTHVTPNTPDFRDTRQARDWASRAGLGAQGDAFVEGGSRVAASTASIELDELISTVTAYLRSQSLWVRREGRWDNDEM
eukprot:jgi/Undpi1/11562/HiC_scaffold_30.g13859.m1